MLLTISRAIWQVKLCVCSDGDFNGCLTSSPWSTGSWTGPNKYKWSSEGDVAKSVSVGSRFMWKFVCYGERQSVAYLKPLVLQCHPVLETPLRVFTWTLHCKHHARLDARLTSVTCITISTNYCIFKMLLLFCIVYLQIHQLYFLSIRFYPNLLFGLLFSYCVWKNQTQEWCKM